MQLNYFQYVNIELNFSSERELPMRNIIVTSIKFLEKKKNEIRDRTFARDPSHSSSLIFHSVVASHGIRTRIWTYTSQCLKILGRCWIEDECDIEIKDKRQHKEQPKGKQRHSEQVKVSETKKRWCDMTKGSTKFMTKRHSQKKCSDLSAIFRKDGKGKGSGGWRVKRAVAPCRVCFLSLKNTHIQWTSNVVSLNF